MINDTVDPTFGGQKPEPSFANTKQLREKVQTMSEDDLLGISTDVDGDRFAVVDRDGNFITANDIGTILSYVNDNKPKYSIQKYSNIDDKEMVKTKRGITKDIFNPWKEEYNKVCDTLLTLETERTFTKYLRKTVQKVAWFGNRLYSFLKIIKP